MIDTSGMAPILALGLVTRERDKFEAAITKDPLSAREIEAFRDRIGTIKTVEDLTNDYETFSFVMKAWGFGGLTYGKAMMERVLVSDPNDKTSLAARMNSGAFKEMTSVLGFSAEGKAPASFKDAAWVNKMVDRYVDRRLVDTQTEANEALGNALYAQEKLAGVKNWYEVLADDRLSEFVRTAFALPSEVASGDIDAQERLLSRKMDIADLKDPEKLEKLVRRYTAIRDALDSQSGQNSLVASLFSSTTATGSWNAVTIDLSLVSGFSASKIR